ncbi:class I SAM-dependent methyltransferase [Chloroflexota bacterium]
MKQSEKKQHVEFQRKIKLRKGLIAKAGKLEGACYVPFIGDGDIAFELYQGNKIYGADIDTERVEVAKSRLKDAEIITADCDKFPFKGQKTVYSLADFDSYSYPYDSFRSFWEEAKFGSQCVLFFTDGQRQAITRAGSYRTPEGKKVKAKTVTEKRTAYNFYFNKTLLPWFREYIKPWKAVHVTKYLRSASMCYWGAIITREDKSIQVKKVKGNSGKAGEAHRNKFDSIKKDEYLELLRQGHTRGLAASLVGIHRATVSTHMKKDKGFAEAVSEAESDAIGKVENALFEAAISGNVTAIQVYLYNRNPERWADRRSVRLAGEGGGPIEVKEIDAKSKLISIIAGLSARIREAESPQLTDGKGS